MLTSVNRFLLVYDSLCNRLLINSRAPKFPIKVISPPEHGFYSKELDYHGIKIKASAVVEDTALFEAQHRLDMMLKNLPEERARLSRRNAELHIIGRNQLTSDLPENRRWKGKKNFDKKNHMDIDERTRGVGGLLASCGEENLLRLWEDRYRGHDICIHEFAHTLMMFGLDTRTREKITKQYRHSKELGLWKGMYAATDAGEFFAELSTWYFGRRGNYGSLYPSPKPGPGWLRNYDPAAYALLKSIYS
jgi:hypothetical protein